MLEPGPHPWRAVYAFAMCDGAGRVGCLWNADPAHGDGGWVGNVGGACSPRPASKRPARARTGPARRLGGHGRPGGRHGHPPGRAGGIGRKVTDGHAAGCTVPAGPGAPESPDGQCRGTPWGRRGPHFFVLVLGLVAARAHGPTTRARRMGAPSAHVCAGRCRSRRKAHRRTRPRFLYLWPGA
jgi:hypothetical protein